MSFGLNSSLISPFANHSSYSGVPGRGVTTEMAKSSRSNDKA